MDTDLYCMENGHQWIFMDMLGGEYGGWVGQYGLPYSLFYNCKNIKSLLINTSLVKIHHEDGHENY